MQQKQKTARVRFFVFGCRMLSRPERDILSYLHKKGDAMKTGTFSKNDLALLIEKRRIVPGATFSQSHVGEASVDVTVTDEVYRIDVVLQPDQRRNETVRDLLPMMGAVPVHFGDTLRVGCSYVAKASVELNLPPGTYGFFNAKSTSGRLFVFVRALADRMFMFDSADRRNEGYSGEIWLVIEPLAFPIVLNAKECFNQLRIFDGDTRFGELELRQLLQSDDLLYRRTTQEPYKQGGLSLFTYDGSVLCTLFAKGKEHIGYRTRSGNVDPIDLSCRNLDPLSYFEPVFAEQLVEGDMASWGVRIEASHYYLLCTNEVYHVPVTCSSELVALDRRLGDVFTHFAGYFDPGFFGSGTLEVFSPRTVFIRHKQPFARFILERMRSPTSSYADRGTYAGQIETKLPKQFLPWG